MRKPDADMVWWSLDAGPWGDGGEQGAREIDCCGVNKSIVLVFGIWDIINYLLKKTKSYSFIPFWGHLSIGFRDYFGKQLKNIAR